MKLKNRNVLITGGASGIGRIMGRIALEKGARTFIIWDINITSAGGMLSIPGCQYMQQANGVQQDGQTQ